MATLTDCRQLLPKPSLNHHRPILPAHLFLPMDCLVTEGLDANSVMVQHYRNYQCQQVGIKELLNSEATAPQLTLFEQQHLQQALERPWSRLSKALQINRLLVFLQGLEGPGECYGMLQQQVLQAWYEGELQKESAVSYVEGSVTAINVLQKSTDGQYTWKGYPLQPSAWLTKGLSESRGERAEGDQKIPANNGKKRLVLIPKKIVTKSDG